MEKATVPEDSKFSRNRLEALVDAVFAFAMTLLVTGFVIPVLPASEAAAELPGRIASMHTEFFSFLIAFFVLASFWLVHHRQFRFVRTVNMTVVRITLFILAAVVMMPFTTNISGDYAGVQVAADLFHVNMFVLGILFLFEWWYLVRHAELTPAGGIGRPEAVNGMRRGCVVPAVSALGFAISFADPSLSMAIYILLIPAFFIVDRVWSVS